MIFIEPNLELPDYIKPPYTILKKTPKKEKEVGKFKKFMEMLNKMQVNIPFFDALEEMHVYAKFMKELLLGKQKLRHGENIAFGGRVQCNNSMKDFTQTH